MLNYPLSLYDNLYNFCANKSLSSLPIIYERHNVLTLEYHARQTLIESTFHLEAVSNDWSCPAAGM